MRNLKKLIILGILIMLINPSYGQNWQVLSANIIYPGGGSDPLIGPWSMGTVDTIVVNFKIDQPQLNTCSRDYFADTMIVDVDGVFPFSAAANSRMEVIKIDNDNFSVKIYCTGLGDFALTAMSKAIPPPACGEFSSYGTSVQPIIVISGSLPIELTRWIAKQTLGTQDVLTEWTTETETNNSHFSVEYMYDGTSEWLDGGRIEGAGNSTEVRNYSHLLKNLKSGYVYIRLKQTDTDGKFTYSSTLSIDVDEQGEKADLAISTDATGDYANIVSSNWHNSPAENYNLIITNTLGQVVSQTQNINKTTFNNTFQIPLPDANGVYAIYITGEEDGKTRFTGKAIR